MERKWTDEKVLIVVVGKGIIIVPSAEPKCVSTVEKRAPASYILCRESSAAFCSGFVTSRHTQHRAQLPAAHHASAHVSLEHSIITRCDPEHSR